MTPMQEPATSKVGALPVCSSIGISKLSSASNKPTSAKAVNEASSASESRSCSAFAEFSFETSIMADPSVTTWLVYRSALPEIKHIHEGGEGRPLYEGQDEFEEMCRSYDDLTSFRWVKKWMASEELPSVDPSLGTLRSEFYNQYSQVSEESWSQIYVDENHAKIIGDRLSMLLSCVNGASTRNIELEDSEPLEAEGKHNWDAMLSSFYVGGEDEVHSYNVLLERELRMPRNALLDTLNDQNAELRDRLATLLLVWMERNRAACSQPAENHDHHAAFFIHSSTTLTESDELLTEYKALLDDPDELHKLVKTQAEFEPTHGKCDAMLIVSPPLHKAQEIYKGFGLVMEDTCSENEGRSSLNSAQASQTQLKHLDHRDLYLNPLSIHGTNEGRTDKCSVAENCPVPVILPQLIAIYSKPDDLEAKTLNEARMYCVAGVEFLAAVGIRSYPVFGLVVHGSVGSVLMAWMTEEGTIHVLERNIRQFDLTKPLEAFQFATFLMRLKAREEELKDRFEKCRAEFVENLVNGKFKNWAMAV